MNAVTRVQFPSMPTGSTVKCLLTAKQKTLDDEKTRARLVGSDPTPGID